SCSAMTSGRWPPLPTRPRPTPPLRRRPRRPRLRRAPRRRARRRERRRHRRPTRRNVDPVGGSVSAIAVVGGGYVGLTTAACFAPLGHDVVCGALDREKGSRPSKGRVPVLGGGRPALRAPAGLAPRRLSFAVGEENGGRNAGFVSLCVQPPLGPDGAADLSALDGAVREIAPVLRPGSVVINKSTVPVGTAAFVERL